MSQLADICGTVDSQPLTDEQKVNLLVEIHEDLGWELLMLEIMDNKVPSDWSIRGRMEKEKARALLELPAQDKEARDMLDDGEES